MRLSAYFLVLFLHYLGCVVNDNLYLLYLLIQCDNVVTVINSSIIINVSVIIIVVVFILFVLAYVDRPKYYWYTPVLNNLWFDEEFDICHNNISGLLLYLLVTIKSIWQKFKREYKQILNCWFLHCIIYVACYNIFHNSMATWFDLDYYSIAWSNFISFHLDYLLLYSTRLKLPYFSSICLIQSMFDGVMYGITGYMIV